MTALCGGGASSAKPGYDRILYVTPFIMGAALNNVPTKIALTLAGLVGSFSFDLNNFCTTDPPAMPTITSDDVLAMLNPIQIFDYLAARQKFQDLIVNYLWVQFCQCNSTSNPPTPTPPAALSNFDPDPTVPGISQSGCLTSDWTGSTADLYSINSTSGPANIEHHVADAFGFIAGPTFTSASYSGPFHTVEVPNGATHYSVFLETFSGQPNALAQPWTYIDWRNSSNALITSTTWNLPQNGSSHQYAVTAIPAGSTYFWYNINPGDTSIQNCTVRIVWYCNNQTGSTPVQPCCPPDLTLQSQVTQILGYVQLLQRQLAPFAYIDGASHTGLTGHGEITVQGLLGIRVHLTTLPGYLGVYTGDPDVIFDAGWINFGDTSGFSNRKFINANPITFFPTAAGQYTRVGYSLNAGVVATITEIVREP